MAAETASFNHFKHTHETFSRSQVSADIQVKGPFLNKQKQKGSSQQGSANPASDLESFRFWHAYVNLTTHEIHNFADNVINPTNRGYL